MNIKKRLTAMLAIMMCAGCGTGETAQKQSAISSPRLVKTVTVYSKDYETGQWREQSVRNYEYENGYPVTMTLVENGGETSSKTTFKYMFDGTAPAYMEQFTEGGGISSVTEYENGRIYRVDSVNEEKTNVGMQMYSYSNEEPYFTLVFHSTRDTSSPEQPYSMEEADSVQVATEDGLLKKTVNSGLYANWNENEAKEWLRFNGTYTAEYENGIVSHTHGVFRSGPSSETRYEATIKDGQVSEVLEKLIREDGNEEESARYEFTYTDEEIDLARYCTMINAHVLQGGGTFYIYNWY